MRFQRFIPALLWLALSIVLLCLPGSRIPKYPWLATIHADKWIHIGLFGMLCILFALPVRSDSLTDQQKLRWLLVISLAGILYGVLIEFVQKNWVLNRSFEFQDILADSLGCLLAYWYNRSKIVRKG